MNRDELKEAVIRAINLHREEIAGIGRDIMTHPEMGYKEFRTSEVVKSAFTGLSLDFADGLAITGIRADAKGGESRAKVAVMGELDAVLCPLHPDADKNTGAAHACGHNAQLAAMLGAAIGLIKSGVMQHLDGDAVFMAVPAEEFSELEFRQRLKQDGKIEFLGGKQELISKGVFDDVDMAMMVHSHAGTTERKVYINGSSTGFIGKTVRFSGKEAHAGGAPHEGINALNAAMASLMCIHAQRETFRDEDHVRVHPIITKGGDLVNIVPADVRMETYVRGRTIDAVLDANEKVNRAILGGAYAIGAETEITEIPGYLPLKQDVSLGELFKKNILEFVEEKNIIEGVDLIGSTDIGDLSALMPVIQPTMGGFSGSAHSREFTIVDEEAAYILPAKAMALTVVDLLFNGAEEALRIKEGFKPQFTKDEYINMWRKLTEVPRTGEGTK